MDDKTKPIPAPAKSVTEIIKEALKPTGLTLLDINKTSTVDGDLYNVRVFDMRKD